MISEEWRTKISTESTGQRGSICMGTVVPVSTLRSGGSSNRALSEVVMKVESVVAVSAGRVRCWSSGSVRGGSSAASIPVIENDTKNSQSGFIESVAPCISGG